MPTRITHRKICSKPIKKRKKKKHTHSAACDREPLSVHMRGGRIDVAIHWAIYLYTHQKEISIRSFLSLWRSFFLLLFFCLCIDREPQQKERERKKKCQTEKWNERMKCLVSKVCAEWYNVRASQIKLCLNWCFFLLSTIRHFNHVHRPNILAKLMKNWWVGRTEDDVTAVTYRFVHREMIKKKQHKYHRFVPWITV